VALLVIALGVSACGGDDDDDGGGGGGAPTGEKKTIAWLFYGPKDDGGYNTSQWNPAQDKIKEQFGDQVEQIETDNLPYDEELSNITESYIAQGAHLLIDTVASGELFTDVCGEHPEVACIELAPAGPHPNPASALPDNVVGLIHEFWNQEYVAGIAAGLMTEADTVGFLAAYEVPNNIGSANAFALGCKSVNPDCKVRLVVVNNYFDPAAERQAAASLVDAGADILHGWTDSPTFCQVAEDRNIRAIGQFFDYREVCPTAFITSTLWNFSDAYVDQVQRLVDDKWNGGQTVWQTLGEGADLASWGENVPDEVKSAVDKAVGEIQDGKSPFVGPIRDQKGKVRVAAGETMPTDDLYRKWLWRVENIE
jgi:basic membrane lipoprotein Med (substrate-binding protein (PBP1-ABC) superfamily)